MEALKLIQKSREYLDYLEEHITNVEKAFNEIKEKCKDMRFIKDPQFFKNLEFSVLHHDKSKLGEFEFTQYRQWFYPIDPEEKSKIKFELAWEHHYIINSHHWENWTKKETDVWNVDDWEVDCAHMIIDWLAMSYKFGDTVQSHYEKNKDNIKLPEKAIPFIYQIFDRL